MGGDVVWLTVFDGADEVGGFLESMVTSGWPVFLAIAGGLVGVTLAALGVRKVFRYLAVVFVGSAAYDNVREAGRELEEQQAWVDIDRGWATEVGLSDPWGLGRR